MKSGIHPTWTHQAQVTCSCGNTFTTGATTDSIQVDICSACHPFFTGEQRFVDRQGRVDKFMARMKKAEEAQKNQKTSKKKTDSTQDTAESQSYKEILRKQQSELRKMKKYSDTVDTHTPSKSVSKNEKTKGWHCSAFVCITNSMLNPFADQIAQLEAKIAETQELLTDPQMKDLAELEIADLNTQKQALEDAAAQMDGGDDSGGADPRTGNCTIEIRQGAGGDEAKIWATDLLRMYIRFIETSRFKVEFIDDTVIKVRGKIQLVDTQEVLSSFEFFQFESGVHRVQRVPETESQGRIHTSTASVAVLPEVPVNAVEIKEEDLDWQFMRAGGAGGQNVNKVSSAVRLTHTPSGIVVKVTQEKKQEQNRKIALELLRSQLWEIEEEKRQKEIGEARSAIGRAQRAEKIRTYNYPQNRITDHRTKQSWHNLPAILDGALLTMIPELRAALLSDEQTEDSDS